MNGTLRSKAYLSIVRPVVEYSSTVWSPHQIGLKSEIEMVQRKAARMVLNQPHRRGQRDSVSDMITLLGWESLESRRIKADLTMLYKTTNNLIKIPEQYHPIPATRSTRSNHEHKLQHIQAATNPYHNLWLRMDVLELIFSRWQGIKVPFILVPS